METPHRREWWAALGAENVSHLTATENRTENRRFTCRTQSYNLMEMNSVNNLGAWRRTLNLKPD